MDTFTDYVARCAVQMFEAAGGSSLWSPKFTAGELHMKPLGNAVLSFQLRDVMTNQILFEHTVCKPEAFTVLSQRFFVIRLENDSFRGFGFAESAAACEMQEQVRKAVKPYEIQEYDRKGPNGIETSFSDKGISAVSASKEDSTIPNKGSSKIPAQPSKEEQISSVSSLEIVAFTETTKTSKWKFSWKRLTNFPYLRNWNTITAAFRWEEHEMQIGYPTDVKHVAHIGWDGPSVCGPSWIDELKPSPGFATGPLKEFGQPMGADWIHDAMSAAKWTAPGLGSMSGAPPPPPAEFLDPGMCRPQKQHSRWNVTWLLRKSKKISSDKLQA